MAYLQTTMINLGETVEIKQVEEHWTWVLGNYSIFPHVAIFAYPEGFTLPRDNLCEICPKNWNFTV